jgi:hypothetical protein
LDSFLSIGIQIAELLDAAHSKGVPIPRHRQFEDFGEATIGNKDVGGLDVAMDDAFSRSRRGNPHHR